MSDQQLAAPASCQTRWVVCFVLTAMGSLPACASTAAFRRTSPMIGELQVRAVEFNTGAIGTVDAVADDGEDVAVFGSKGASIFRSGALVATDARVTKWIGAATIPAADGAGNWLVGVDVAGAVYRIRGRSKLESIGDRYRLSTKDTRIIVPMGGKYIGFGRCNGFSVADGNRIRSFDVSGFGGDHCSTPPAEGQPPTNLVVAGAMGRLALALEDDLRVFDFAHEGNDRRFTLSDVTGVAFDRTARLYASTKRAIFEDDGLDRLRLRYVAEDRISSLVSANQVIWFLDEGELGAVAERQVKITKGLHLADGTKLFGSTSGDVWTAFTSKSLTSPSGLLTSGETTLRRLRIDTGALDWSKTIAPIGVRVCQTCHSAKSDTGVDLASEGDWNSRRARILARVVEKKDMPPVGFPLTDEERRAIQTWALASPRPATLELAPPRVRP